MVFILLTKSLFFGQIVNGLVTEVIVVHFFSSIFFVCTALKLFGKSFESNDMKTALQLHPYSKHYHENCFSIKTHYENMIKLEGIKATLKKYCFYVH